MEDVDRSAYAGIIVVQVDDVLVKEADASLAGASWNGGLVIGASVDSDALESARVKTHEPVAVRENVSTAVAEVVSPAACILNLADLERNLS